MNQPIHLQELLFQSIKQKLDPGLSFVHDLSELLGISYDSAYRRIRGEKELSLEELKAVCLHYGISADALFGISHGQVVFHSLAVGEKGFDIRQWLLFLLEAIRKIHAAKEREIIYAAKDIPVFYFFEFPEIAAFKIYFWNKALIPASGYEDRKLTLDAPEDLYDTGRLLLSHYIKIPTSEIWSEETVSSILRQIEYCFVSGFFERPQDAFRLCDVLETWLDHVQGQAEHGFQYVNGRQAEGIPNTFRLYNNEVLVTDNIVLVNTDGKKASYYTYNVINQLITSDPVFCDQVENSLANLMQKSTIISGTSAKERYRFFNILHEKVRALRGRIERMI